MCIHGLLFLKSSVWNSTQAFQIIVSDIVVTWSHDISKAALQKILMLMLILIFSCLIVAFSRFELGDNIVSFCDDINNQTVVILLYMGYYCHMWVYTVCMQIKLDLIYPTEFIILSNNLITCCRWSVLHAYCINTANE